ncbi:hypothetical protein OS493_026505 [Desmophyllum pertusum]|uniref:Alpha-type protein kinase domain-containing protein n=1 Tax=Desmophyllum pertusum TaxID=174260 RepID=A0A9W9YL53_9CNID|nr:hypothetical protein OS493_026505 [Desmophyllum pertusum]
MADWRDFKAKMRTKRIDKGKGKKKDTAGAWNQDNDTLVVQRLSAEVSGKAQKYSRIGAREFVSYEYEEFMIENIRNACQKHFSVDETMTCDVVAGEQGPSCSSVKQIPDSKVVHVRFVERVAIGEPDEGIEVTRVDGPAVKSPPAKRRFSGVENGTQNRSQPTKSAPSPSKFVPRSLSVVEMLKLGKAITQSTTSVSIYSFDLQQMSWSRIPSTIDFSIQKEPFGTGGFREAYKATSNAKGFESTTWVIKKYLPKTVSDIQATGQTVEQHTKKVVQMHYLARNFAARLRQELQSGDNLVLFGETLRYNKLFLGKLDSDEYVTVEEFLEGSFVKPINNDGRICGDISNPVCNKAETLAHYSFERSNKQIMIVDIQGCEYFLFDPEIASKELKSDDELFSALVTWHTVLYTILLNTINAIGIANC